MIFFPADIKITQITNLYQLPFERSSAIPENVVVEVKEPYSNNTKILTNLRILVKTKNPGLQPGKELINRLIKPSRGLLLF